MQACVPADVCMGPKIFPQQRTNRQEEEKEKDQEHEIKQEDQIQRQQIDNLHMRGLAAFTGSTKAPIAARSKHMTRAPIMCCPPDLHDLPA